MSFCSLKVDIFYPLISLNILINLLPRLLQLLKIILLIIETILVTSNISIKLYHIFIFQALIDSTSSENCLDSEPGVRMVALFDNEEVGSNSAQGAGSPVLLDALTRVTESFSSPNSKVKSFIISYKHVMLT